MKKIVKILPILTIIILTVLVVFKEDVLMRSQYTRFSDYELRGIHLDEKTLVNGEADVKRIFKIAKENNVILVKELYNKKQKRNNVYMTVPNLQEFISKYVEVKEHKSATDNTHIPTLARDEKTTKFYINDFLANDDFVFYKGDSLFTNNEYVFGDYSLLYKNDMEWHHFLDQVAKEMDIAKENIPIEGWGMLNSHEGIITLAITIAFVIFALFFLLVILFLLYKKSKKIGCLQLLGYTQRSLILLSVKDYIYFELFAIVICMIVSLSLLSNITFSIVLNIIQLHILVVLLSISVTCLGMLFIKRYTSLSNIIKKTVFV
ncbi:MAG: hypothetical protein ACK5KR_05330 [Breznakia sp.]